MKLFGTLVCLSWTLGAVAPTPARQPVDRPAIHVLRVPDAGIQPDVVVDAEGVLHLVYLAGPPGSADVFYTYSRDGGQHFVPRVRVNSQPGSAIAMGTIRGAQVALGRDGRVHVVWNGSSTAEPKPPVRQGQTPGAPLLYAGSLPGSTAFAPQRNLITATRHLDGGSSVAADEAGNVFVAWHANALDGAEGEEARRVWLARSTDDGSSNVDNNAFGAMFTYSLSGHSFGAAYQKMSGDTGFAYINGTDAFLVNYALIAADFANPGEKSWQARYDYNFAAIGVPGLTFMTRYIKGDNFDVGSIAGKEWERDTFISYIVQQGHLKNLGLKWINATYRNNFNRDIDQNRLVVSYTIPLL